MSSSRGSDFNSKDLKMMMDLIDDNLKNGYVLSSSSKRVSKPPVRYSDISESFSVFAPQTKNGGKMILYKKCNLVINDDLL